MSRQHEHVYEKVATETLKQDLEIPNNQVKSSLQENTVGKNIDGGGWDFLGKSRNEVRDASAKGSVASHFGVSIFVTTL